MSRSNRIEHQLTNLFYQVVAVAILFPSVTLASEAASINTIWGLVQEETDSYRLGRERLERFNEVNPFLRQEEGDTLRSFTTACSGLMRSCLRYLRDEKADARHAVRDNPEYWESYLGLFEVTPLKRLPDDFNDDLLLHKLINATRHWTMNQLLIRGFLDADEVHFVIGAHRRLLAESNFLIDKIVFLASFSNSLMAVNILMAQHAHSFPPLEPAKAKLLDEMLQPMTRAEYSMRRIFHGESRRMAGQIAKELIEKGVSIDEPQLEDVYRIYDYVADRSEASWSDLWGGGLDVWVDVPIYSIEEAYVASYSNYVSNFRYMDANLYLLRALREIYEGRTSPGIPAQPPPARWHWQWHVANQALCLTPGDIHVSFQNVPTICYDYFEEQDVTM